MNTVIRISVFLAPLVSMGLMQGMEPIENLIQHDNLPQYGTASDEMFEAIEANDCKKLERSLDNGASINGPQSPLLKALNRDNIKIARLLLDRGACPNTIIYCNELSRKESLLDHCIGTSENERAKLLYLYGAQSHKQKVTSWIPTLRNPFGSTSEVSITSIDSIKALFKTDPEDVLACCAMFDEPNLGETLRRVLKPNCGGCCVDKKRLAASICSGASIARRS